jgi:ATP-dependent Clp protease ATP-binding subunit ClpA
MQRSAMARRSGGSGAMFERFTDRARRVVVLARQEARHLGHDHVGTEHILLGLLREGEGVAVNALVALGIDLQDVRQRVDRQIGRGAQAPSGHVPFTGPAKHVLELSLREALQFGHNYIGTEHILLGLIREEDGVAARVLAEVGADAGNVRRQVVLLLHGYAAAQSQQAQSQQAQSQQAQSRQTIASVLTGRGRRIDEIHQGIEAIMARLTAIEDALGIPSSPVPQSLRELSRRIATVRKDKEDAIDARHFEQAARLREQEKQLIREQGAEETVWLAQSGRGQRGAGAGAGGVAEAETVGGADVAEMERLGRLVERLQRLLHEHDIDGRGETVDGS